MDELQKRMHERMLEALRYISGSEKPLHSTASQAMCLSSAKYCELYDLSSINRNVDMVWVKEIKKSIIQMEKDKIMTTISVCIDLIDIYSSFEDLDAARHFKAMIIDGQHRVEAMKQLCREDPTFNYQFFLNVYICNDSNHMQELFLNLNKHLPVSQVNIDEKDTRKRFVDAFSRCTINCNDRRCVQRTKNHPILRDQNVMTKLSTMTVAQIEEAIYAIAKQYEEEFKNTQKLKPTSMVYKTIKVTKMYQLVDWEEGNWIKRMLSVQESETPLVINLCE